jgi:hypothetical protein
MNSRAWLVTFCALLMCLWEETGQNPFVFCYRIAWGAFWNVRAYAMAPIAAPTRDNAECLTPSSTFSTRCSTPRD